MTAVKILVFIVFLTSISGHPEIKSEDTGFLSMKNRVAELEEKLAASEIAAEKLKNEMEKQGLKEEVLEAKVSLFEEKLQSVGQNLKNQAETCELRVKIADQEHAARFASRQLDLEQLSKKLEEQLLNATWQLQMQQLACRAELASQAGMLNISPENVTAEILNISEQAAAGLRRQVDQLTTQLTEIVETHNQTQGTLTSCESTLQQCLYSQTLWQTEEQNLQKRIEFLGLELTGAQLKLEEMVADKSKNKTSPKSVGKVINLSGDEGTILISHNTGSWFEMRDTCWSIDMFPLEFQTAKKQRLVYRKIKGRALSPSRVYWFGLTAEYNPTPPLTFMYSGGSNPIADVRFTHWRGGHPAQDLLDHRCAAIDAVDGRWVNLPCATKLNFICQRIAEDDDED